jgi:hypothetical protein
VASGCTRLLPLLIEAMERHGHGGLNGQNRQQLLAMSAATIDRILKTSSISFVKCGTLVFSTRIVADGSDALGSVQR